jgi:hypothetical protein
MSVSVFSYLRFWGAATCHRKAVLIVQYVSAKQFEADPSYGGQAVQIIEEV